MFTCFDQVFCCLFRIFHSLLDIIVNPVQHSSLFNNDLIELLEQALKLFHGFDQSCDLFASVVYYFIHFVHLHYHFLVVVLENEEIIRGFELIKRSDLCPEPKTLHYLPL